MHKRVIGLIGLLFFVGNSFVVQAQQDKTKTQIELSLVWGVAQGTFGDNLDHSIPGILFSFGGRTPQIPLVLSTEIGWLNYGFDNRLHLRFSNSANTPATSVVNVDAANSMLTTHLVAQVVPFEGKISPYIGGLLGFKYLTTNIDIESEVLFDDNDVIIVGPDNRIRTSSAFKSFTISYGVSAGANIQVFKGNLGMQKTHTTISIHLGARYLFGSEADYLTENSIQSQTDGIHFEQFESDTDILIPKLGLQLEF